MLNLPIATTSSSIENSYPNSNGSIINVDVPGDEENEIIEDCSIRTPLQNIEK
jgi:hypothetical protein